MISLQFLDLPGISQDFPMFSPQKNPVTRLPGLWEGGWVGSGLQCKDPGGRAAAAAAAQDAAGAGGAGALPHGALGNHPAAGAVVVTSWEGTITGWW